ncbi:MAG: hypothetical protein ABSE63_04480 [Thermoguttaceae bacterium]
MAMVNANPASNNNPNMGSKPNANQVGCVEDAPAREYVGDICESLGHLFAGWPTIWFSI